MPLVAILEAWSLPEQVTLAVLIVALVYVILYWAGSTLFGGLLRAMANNIPFVGGWIGDAVGGVLSAVNSWAGQWVDGAIYGLVRLTVYVPQAIIAFLDTVVGGFEWVITQVTNLGAAILSNVMSIFFQLANLTLQIAAHSGLISLLQTGVADLRRTTDWLSATFVPAQIRSLYEQVTTDIANAVGNAVHNVETDIAAVDASLSSDLANAERNIASIDSTLTTQVWPAIDGLTSVVDTLSPLAVPATIAAILSGVTFLATTWTLDAAECAIAGCAATSPFRDMMNLLQTTELLAGVAALTIAAVEHPHETAQATAAVANDILSIGRGLASEFTGL